MSRAARLSAAWAFALGCILLLAPVTGLAAEEKPIEATAEKGPVKAHLRLEPPAPLIGDPVELTLMVTSAKDVEVLMPEFGEALERFRILDFVPRESLAEDGGTVHTQRYRLLPPASGPQSIPPLLIEFVDRRQGAKPAPEGLDAYELLTERLDFTVESVLPADADAQLEPPLGRLEPLAPPSAPLWPWLLGALVLLSGLVLWLRPRLAARRHRARLRSAYELASARLDRLLARPDPQGDAVHGYYVELSDVVRQYLEVRFDLRAPEMSTEEFLAVVSRSPDLEGEHQRLLRDFLKGADLVKFAHVVPEQHEIRAAADSARRFFDETREEAPLLDEAAAARLEEAAGA